jgi:hypothetical protein
MTFQFGSELTFTGPALPESFIQHELEHALGKALPSAKDAEAGWKALLKSLREPLTSAGSIRVRNVVINPVMKALGYAEMIAAEDVRTREGDEPGGVLLLPSPVGSSTGDGGGTKGGGLRVWAVAYEDDLDAPSKRGQNYRFSPGRVAERVLLATGERIGLLTNGLELRLIFSDPARRASFASFSLSQWKQLRYTDPVPDAFRVLIAFAQADAQRDARLQDVIEQARLKQGQVTKDLRVQARKAVEAFVQSVLDHPANKEILRDYVARNDVLAKQLWREALTMIYRMLFILRGESGGRETPPFSFASTSLWRNTYSPSNAQPGNLAWVAQKVREEGMPSGEFLEAGLRAIFKAFEHGLNATELHIAPLGGALFGAESTPLLDRLKWGEHGCAELIDNLLRAPRGKGQGRSLVRLSYRDLGVEELGRVYEALLELEPGISAEAMVRLRRAKLEVVVPLEQGEKYRPKDEGGGMRDEAIEEAEESIDAEDESQGDASQSEISNQKSKIEWVEAIAPDQFYLRVGLGRKSSGGHYTPDTFVRFLVQETLGPLIEALSPKDDPQPLAILRLNVLDGAMGSGHILIGACRFMGERLYEACVACAERGLWERIPVEVAPYLPGRRPEGESEAGLSAEKARAMCKRLVAVHCLYGVDKNPLAVSLAKVSLWLESFAEGLPLTFLDHRLVCGDSLLGPINLFGDAANTAADSPMTPPYATTPIDVALAQGVKAQLRDRLGVALQRVRDLDATVGTDEADIAAKHNAKRDLDAALQPFIDLCVAWSGGIMLGREHVDEDGYREAMQLVATGAWPIDPLADDGPLTAGFRTMLQKGRNAGVLVYPLVFPEVFFPTSDVDHMEGFDAEVMNPPWDRMLPADKEFFAAYDLGVLAAPTKRERDEVEGRLKSNPDVAAAHEAYIGGFRAAERMVRVIYRHQVVEVYGESTIGKQDLYRLFLERIAQLLRTKGLSGVVVPSAFYASEGATGIRRLYFRSMSLQFCYSFENRKKIFEIDSRLKFALVAACKDSNGTLDFSCAFYLHDTEWLFGNRHPLTYTLAFVQQTGGEYLSLMELRDATSQNTVQVCFDNGEPFLTVCERNGIRFGRELNMTDDAKRFVSRDSVCKDSDPRDPSVAQAAIKSGYLTLNEGKTFHQFTDKWGMPSRFMVDLAKLQDKPQWIKAAQYFRLQFREIAQPTNERTAIASIQMPGTLNSYTATNERTPWTRPTYLSLYICAAFDSFIFDWLSRQFLQNHMTLALLSNLRLPRTQGEATTLLTHSALRLTCNHAGYAPLWAEQLGGEWREGTPRHTWPVLAGDDARWDVRAAIDAVVAQAYGLSREQYAHVLSTFSHKSYPSAPKVCLAKFDELGEIGLEAFTRKYDPYWDVPLVESLPRPVIELPNLTPGEGRVVAEGKVEYGATDMFGNPLQTDLFGEVVTATKKRGRRKK